MGRSLLTEEWRAQEFYIQFAEEMKGIDCKLALEEEGDMNNPFSELN